MKNYTFSFEIQTLLEQFVGAFNDIIIKRYDNTKTVVPSSSAIKVDFVYAPKQRVYDTLNTPAPGGMTVPVVAVNITGISRDAKRVFNKLEGFYIDNYDDSDGSFIKKIPQPVPINIGISMTIVTKLQSDMDQIVSNFVPYCDPYIIISWKIPNPKNPKNPYEIRSEVLWDGNIQLQYPDNLAANQPYRLTATTNFTIKGWLFKKMDETVKKIYTIDSTFISSDGTTSENDVISVKPSIIKDFNTVFGVNQGINVTDFSIQTTADDIKNFKNTYSTVYGTSGNWEFAYDWIQGNSPSINNAVLYVQSNSGIEINQQLATNYVIVNSARFEDSYTTVNTLSSDWEMIYTYVTKNSGIEINQQAVATLVNTNSSFWDLAYSNTLALSTQHASLYSIVNANSATTWNYQGTDLKNLSSGWVGGHEAYTNLLANSAKYILSGTNVNLSFLSVSANWNSVYSNVNSNSSTWNYQGYDLKALSSTWVGGHEAYTNLLSNSAAYLSGVDLSFLSISANWNSVYSNVNSNSSNWDSVYTTTISNSAIWSVEDRLTSGSHQVVLSEDGRLNIPGVLTVPSLSGGRILTVYPFDDIQGFYGQSDIPILQNGVDGTINISNQGLVTISNQGRDYTNGIAIIGGGTRVIISVTPLGWVFNSDGSITFPDNTTQTTAFTGVTIPPIDRLDNGTVQVVLNEDGSLLLPASGIISNVVSTDEIGFNIAGLFNFSGQTSVDLNAFNVGLGNPTWGPTIQANPTDYEIIFNDGLVATITGATGTASPGARWDLTGVWQANPTGAPVTIRSKNYRPSVLGTDGIKLSTNNKNWTFKNDGSITFPDNTTQTTAFTGVTIPPSDRLNNGTVQVVLSSDNLLYFPTGTIGDTLQDGGFTILGNPGSYAELASNDGNVYAWASDTNYGNPVGGGFSIGTAVLSSGYIWTFGNDGLLHFPNGSIQTTAFLNNLDLYASLNYVDNNFLNLSGGLVSGPVRINNDLTVFGNLTASGTTTFANTIFSTTSSLSVVHVGSGPALWVGNNGDGDIASFYDIDQGIEILHVGGVNSTHPNVGIKTSEPNVDFTVNGQISANNIIWDANGNSNNWNSAFNTATIYQNTSGSFATNTLLKSISALLTPLTLTSTLTSQLVLNTAINSLTGNWNTAYASTTALNLSSGNWNKAYNIAIAYQGVSGTFVSFDSGVLLPFVVEDTAQYPQTTVNLYNTRTVQIGSNAYGNVYGTNDPNNFTNPTDVAWTFEVIKSQSTYYWKYSYWYTDGENNYEIILAYKAINDYNNKELLLFSGTNWYSNFNGGSLTNPYPSVGTTFSLTSYSRDAGAPATDYIGSAGTSIYASHSDHTHPLPTTQQLGAASQTDFNGYKTNVAASTATLLPTTVYRNASGSFATNTLLQSTSSLLTPLTLTRTLTSTLLTDAPSNGSQYARQNGAWTVVSGGGSSVYSIVNVNFNALVNQKYLVDTTSSSIVGTLPSSPSLGDNISFVDSNNTWGVRPLILNNNGNLLQTFNEPLTANISGYQFQLVYVGGSYGWKIV